MSVIIVESDKGISLMIVVVLLSQNKELMSIERKFWRKTDKHVGVSSFPYQMNVELLFFSLLVCYKNVCLSCVVFVEEGGHYCLYIII